MPATVAQRPRITIDVPEEVRLAMKLAAAKADRSVNEIILEILYREFAAEIRDAKKYVPKRTDE